MVRFPHISAQDTWVHLHESTITLPTCDSVFGEQTCWGAHTHMVLELSRTCFLEVLKKTAQRHHYGLSLGPYSVSVETTGFASAEWVNTTYTITTLSTVSAQSYSERFVAHFKPSAAPPHWLIMCWPLKSVCTLFSSGQKPVVLQPCVTHAVTRDIELGGLTRLPPQLQQHSARPFPRTVWVSANLSLCR